MPLLVMQNVLVDILCELSVCPVHYKIYSILIFTLNSMSVM
jgi:hypothetical protein